MTIIRATSKFVLKETVGYLDTGGGSLIGDGQVCGSGIGGGGVGHGKTQDGGRAVVKNDPDRGSGGDGVSRCGKLPVG